MSQNLNTTRFWISTAPSGDTPLRIRWRDEIARSTQLSCILPHTRWIPTFSTGSRQHPRHSCLWLHYHFGNPQVLTRSVLLDCHLWMNLTLRLCEVHSKEVFLLGNHSRCVRSSRQAQAFTRSKFHFLQLEVDASPTEATAKRGKG